MSQPPTRDGRMKLPPPALPENPYRPQPVKMSNSSAGKVRTSRSKLTDKADR